MQLDPIAAAAGVRLESLKVVGSTNEEARIRARHGERGPLWITADTQTQGRGRMGRFWVSPQGNLYASLLLFDPSPVERAPELAFVAVLAVRDAIAAIFPTLAPRLSFKWPNDLLLAGEKCGGILIEGELDPRHSASVVIGIGVNCAHHPSNLLDRMPPDIEPPPHQLTPREESILFPATDLHVHGANIPPQQLFMQLSATMCRRIAQWDHGRGFPVILSDWLAAARGIGEQISVRNDGNVKTGRFAGLDQSGRLVLETSTGSVEKISAGDVFRFERRGDQPVPNGQG